MHTTILDNWLATERRAPAHHDVTHHDLARHDEPPPVDVAIVGGGLAGLTAAVVAARAGRSVVLFERASAPGGRAVTREIDGFRFNVGPHALYRGGAGLCLLRQLGIEPKGGLVAADRAFALRQGRLHRLPAGLTSFVTSSLFGLGGKLALARALAWLSRLDPASLAGLSVDAWLERDVAHPDVRALVAMLVRTATYSDDSARMSASAAARQVKIALASVIYVDGGWQTLVDSLRTAAVAAGARIAAGARVAAVEAPVATIGAAPAVRGVRLADGTFQPSSAVILAVPPAAASGLVAGGEHTALQHRAATAVPVRAASLDVGLRRLPNPDVRVVFGIDRPVYLSVHSTWARLAPAGGAMIHVLKYLGASSARGATDEDEPAAEAELEALLDLVQPGWREVVAVRRFLPDLTVMGALPTVAEPNAVGRQGVAVPGIEGLYVAGDWATADGLLADAALTSGAAAAHAAIDTAASRPATPRPAR